MSDHPNSALRQAASRIAENLANLETERRHIALEAFRILEQHDREIASHAAAVFEDREDAALWFMHPLPFAGVSPWDLLAAGEFEKVHAILNTLSDGMPCSD